MLGTAWAYRLAPVFEGFGGAFSAPRLAPVMLGTPGNAQAQAANGAAQTAPRIPFVRASHRYLEKAFDTTFTPGAATVDLGPFDVPPYGFIRAIRLLITSTLGVLGAGVLSADYPFNALSRVSLQDTNGYPLVLPISGYQLMLANIVGGYRGFNDPTVHPDYSATINPSLMLRLPVEITPWDAFGALANQNPQSPFRVSLTGNTSAAMFSTAPTTPPLIRIRGYLEAWAPVPGQNMRQQAQETAPPGHGATQYWSVETPNVSAASQQVPIRRVGNLIRNIVMVFRDATGARSALVEPDELSFRWDGRNVRINEPAQMIRADFRDATGINLPTGVLPYVYTDDQDGTAGFESRHMYLPTAGSTRLEVEGTFGAVGTVEILTNDLAETQLGR